MMILLVQFCNYLFRRDHLKALSEMRLPRDYLAKFTGNAFSCNLEMAISAEIS